MLRSRTRRKAAKRVIVIILPPVPSTARTRTLLRLIAERGACNRPPKRALTLASRRLSDLYIVRDRRARERIRDACACRRQRRAGRRSRCVTGVGCRYDRARLRSGDLNLHGDERRGWRRSDIRNWQGRRDRRVYDTGNAAGGVWAGSEADGVRHAGRIDIPAIAAKRNRRVVENVSNESARGARIESIARWRNISCGGRTGNRAKNLRNRPGHRPYRRRRH